MVGLGPALNPIGPQGGSEERTLQAPISRQFEKDEQGVLKRGEWEGKRSNRGAKITRRVQSRERAGVANREMVTGLREPHKKNLRRDHGTRD